jgi:hypothetical protein
LLGDAAPPSIDSGAAFWQVIAHLPEKTNISPLYFEVTLTSVRLEASMCPHILASIPNACAILMKRSA